MFFGLSKIALAGAACVCLLGAGGSDRSTSVARGAEALDVFQLHELGGMISINLAISPDAREVAFFERVVDLDANRYHHWLVVMNIATGARRILADAGDVILASTDGRRSGAPLDRLPAWSPDGASIYFLAEREGRAEIWRAATRGALVEAVVQGPADVRRFYLSQDGQALIYETIAPRAALAAQRAEEEANGFLVGERFAPLYSLRPLPEEESGVGVHRRQLNEALSTRASEAERAALAPLGPRPNLFVRPLDPAAGVDEPALGLFSTASSDAPHCLDEACTGALEDAWRGRIAGEDAIAFRRLEGHARSSSALYVWRLAGNRVHRIRRAEERLQGCEIAGEELVCVQDFLTQPRRLVRIDLTSGALRTLYDPNPEWGSLSMPRVERIDFTDGEGNQSYAHLVYPLDYRRGRRYPMVIVQYRSRGFLNAGTGGETPIFPLSSRGYFVLSVDRPEFRERSARMSLNELQRETELSDVEHSAKREAIMWFIAELERRDLIDSSRIGITGMSDGAETVYDMLVDAPMFAAAVASNPPPNPIAWTLQSRRFREGRQHRFGMRAPWDERAPEWTAWWFKNDPAQRVERINAPLLLNLSESEALQAFPLLARLEETATPFESYIYPGAFHIKWRPSQIWAAQQRSLDWLDFWLRGAEREASEDPGRLTRWRGMRARLTAQRAEDAD